MSFLLDTDTCSFHLKRPSGLIHRFIQHSGGLYLSTVALGELYAWAYHKSNSAKIVSAIQSDLLPDVQVLDFDSVCAEQFGILRGTLMKQGTQVATPDLMIAAVALVYNLTLVTHNTADYQHIPALRLDDWWIP
jgi:tRNA(fMet)-specific endonuclease VapC